MLYNDKTRVSSCSTHAKDKRANAKIKEKVHASLIKPRDFPTVERLAGAIISLRVWQLFDGAKLVGNSDKERFRYELNNKDKSACASVFAEETTRLLLFCRNSKFVSCFLKAYLKYEKWLNSEYRVT